MYTEKQLQRIIELFDGIEGNKTHEYAAPTYRDSPALREMAEIILGDTSDTAEVLADKIPVLRYLGKCYDEMCRAGISVTYYKRLLECHVKLLPMQAYSEAETKRFEDDFYHAVYARNRYVPDDCADLSEMVRGHISDVRIHELLHAVKARRAGLPKYDPVELTAAYLAVIDEVEALIEQNMKLRICHEYWSLKADYLEERGIRWRTPSMLNPGMRFD